MYKTSKKVLLYVLVLFSVLLNIAVARESGLPLEKEKLLGTLFMQQLHGSDCVVLDPSINDYLQSLGNRLAESSGIKDYKLHFFGVNSDELNAFAFFGGHVAVHTGLIQQVQSESELAAVLAHETAHIAQKHLPRMLEQNQKLLPLTIAQLLAATAVGMIGGGEAGAQLATAALANHVQQLINYTHEHEQEADRIGMQILTKSNFNPQAMASVFQGMQKKSMYQSKAFAYLRTHPLFESRIADAENRAAVLPYRQTSDTLMFHLVRAKLELTRRENDSDRVKRLKIQFNSGQYPNAIAAEYAYALALGKNNQFQEALKHLRALATKAPSHWMIELSLAETEYAAGNTTAALYTLKKLLVSSPKHPPVILSYATILLDLHTTQSGQLAEKLLLSLLTQQQNYPADPFTYELLTRVQSQLHKSIACHQSQAEWHAARGEFPKALQQLSFALEKTKQPSTLATLITKRKEILIELYTQQKAL